MSAEAPAAPVPDWLSMITASMAVIDSAPTAETFVQAWGTASQAVTVSCDDGADWVIKGRQTGKQAVTDQVLGILGRAMGCPVPEVGQVDVPAALIAAEPALQHLPPGRAHASKYSAGCTGREQLAHAVPENFPRFAHLAAFYGLGLADDHQFIYRVSPPPLVYSVDHGHFIGAGSWTEGDLQQLGDQADLDGQIEAHCPASAADLEQVYQDLGNLTDDAIARAVARPPTDWDVSMGERTSLAALLARRRDHLKVRLEERMP